MIHCIYHNADLDGICCAAIVLRKYPDAVLHGMNYGDELPEIPFGARVIMCDFALLPRERMIEFSNKVVLTWIDHHRTAIEDLDSFAPGGQGLRGLRREGIGACVLTWEHLFPTEPLPEGVRLLGEYDVWNHSDQKTLPFQYGMRLKNLKPDDGEWEFLWDYGDCETTINGVVHVGKQILAWEEQQNAIRIRALRHDVKFPEFGMIRPHFCTLHFLAANYAITNSQLFDSVWEVEKNKYAGMLVYNWRKGRWNVSLYSTHDDIDCGAIAKMFGGGGHPGAAGFQCDELPFEGGPG